MLSSKAYTEVYYIISSMSEEERAKIPEKILKNIEDRMDKEYEFYVEDDDFENVELLEDTEKILSVLYTDYFATDEEREVILNKEKILANKNKTILPDVKIHDVFISKEENEAEHKSKDKSEKTNPKEIIEVKKEKWYEKVLKFFKNFLK